MRDLALRDPATGKTYAVVRGLGGEEWGLFERKPNGSLRRVKTVPMSADRDEAEAEALLHAIKKKPKWIPI